jgi:hypothetical protein
MADNAAADRNSKAEQSFGVAHPTICAVPDNFTTPC